MKVTVTPNLSLIISLFLALFFAGCTNEKEDPAPIDDDPIIEDPIIEDPVITAADVDFGIGYYSPFNNTIYPSVILGLASSVGQSGEGFGLFTYSVEPWEKDYDLKITMSQSKINSESIFRKTIKEKSAINLNRRHYEPEVAWNYDNLRAMDQPGNVDLSFTCNINGEDMDNDILKLSYRSVNECVFGFIDENNEFQDWGWMFAGYVNEDHLLIDKFLKEALDHKIVNSFSGYQQDEDGVFNQVFAIWYNLHKKGTQYSSITDTSNPDDRVFTQYVRFFDEVYENEQANCVDGSVFICSILKKIGISPTLIIIPGHMYMGYYLKDDKSVYRLLETTAIGNIDLSRIYEKNENLYLKKSYFDDGIVTQEMVNKYYSGEYSVEDIRKLVSYNLFVYSTNYRVEDFNSYSDKFGTDVRYQHYKVDELRKKVQPIK